MTSDIEPPQEGAPDLAVPLLRERLGLVLETHVDAAAQVVRLLRLRQLEVEHEELLQRLAGLALRLLLVRVEADLAAPLQRQRHAGKLVGRRRHFALDARLDRTADAIRRPDLDPLRARGDQGAIALRHDDPYRGCGTLGDV